MDVGLRRKAVGAEAVVMGSGASGGGAKSSADRLMGVRGARPRSCVQAPLFVSRGAWACEASGLALLPAAIHAGLPHHFPEPGCGGTASLPLLLLLEGLGPAGHQGGTVEGDHRLAGLQGRPRPLADPPASLSLCKLRGGLRRVFI